MYRIVNTMSIQEMYKNLENAPARCNSFDYIVLQRFGGGVALQRKAEDTQSDEVVV